MIISRTPFRLSLAGGGSDFAEYYCCSTGNVISMGIDRYMYVAINKRFDDSLRVSYTKTEIVGHIDHLEHDLIREAMKLVGLTKGLEITTIADLPAGIGLGSSSTLAVGVLNALHAMKGEWWSVADLARQACELEIECLGRPIGKQDQYIAAFGGLQDIRFLSDGSVSVHPVVCNAEIRKRLLNHLLLFYTGIHRDASSVLGEARQRLEMDSEAHLVVDELVQLASEVRRELSAGRVECIGRLLDESWGIKKRMASRVSNGHLDELYRTARSAGALGGKISGAGGGGCLLLFAPPKAHATVRAAMTTSGLREVQFDLEPEGTRIVHYS